MKNSKTLRSELRCTRFVAPRLRGKRKIATFACQRCGNALTQINPNFYGEYSVFTRTAASADQFSLIKSPETGPGTRAETRPRDDYPDAEEIHFAIETCATAKEPLRLSNNDKPSGKYEEVEALCRRSLYRPRGAADPTRTPHPKLDRDPAGTHHRRSRQDPPEMPFTDAVRLALSVPSQCQGTPAANASLLTWEINSCDQHSRDTRGLRWTPFVRQPEPLLKV